MDAYTLIRTHAVVLASASPRRRDLMAAARIPCRVEPADIAEVLAKGETAEEYARRLAWEKAHAVKAGEREVVVAADTTVVVDEHVLEKPADGADAARMLRLLAGRGHEVMTGVCVRAGERARTAVERTRVRVAAMSEDDIGRYIDSGEAFGKAGAYGIQGMFARWIEGVEGCYFNVVGLPVRLVWRELEALAREMGDGDAPKSRPVRPMK